MKDDIFLKFKSYLNFKDKKKMSNLAIIFIIGIIILLISSIFIDKGLNTGEVTNILKSNSDNTGISYEEELENRLEDILIELKGVSKVKVMITLEESIIKIPAYNTSNNSESNNESDGEGGRRNNIREDKTSQIVLNNQGDAIVLQEVNPVVRGAIVIAKGADDIIVKEEIYNAVKTVLGINGNRVEVYSGE